MTKPARLPSNSHVYSRYFSRRQPSETEGIYVTTCGESIIAPLAPYPPIEHPPSHHFDWQHGRRLSEYQIVYVSEGAGTIETSRAAFRVAAGDAILLVPGMWHRYKPDDLTGWHEHWVGFAGTGAEQVFHAGLLKRKSPVIPIREEKIMLDSFHHLFQSAREGTPGLRQILAGRTSVLIALLYSSMQPLSVKARSETQIIEQARSLMLAEQIRDMPLEDIAKSLNISYTSFRRTFREHTGASPHQYRLHFKISGARELLRSTDLRVKEISYRCGFDDEQYFCRIFKRQTGNTPVEFRARSRRPKKPDFL
jgi:AraC-like DNA-binding protein